MAPIIKKTTAKIVSRKKLLRNLNLPLIMCDYIIGKEHKTHHRLIAGACFMLIGAMFSELGTVTTLVIVHSSINALGELCHGFGTIPWIEVLADRANDFRKQKLTRENQEKEEETNE